MAWAYLPMFGPPRPECLVCAPHRAETSITSHDAREIWTFASTPRTDNTPPIPHTPHTPRARLVALRPPLALLRPRSILPLPCSCNFPSLCNPRDTRGYNLRRTFAPRISGSPRRPPRAPGNGFPPIPTFPGPPRSIPPFLRPHPVHARASMSFLPIHRPPLTRTFPPPARRT